MVKFIGMVGQPRRNSAKMVSWSRVSEHLVNLIGMSDQLKWNNHFVMLLKEQVILLEYMQIRTGLKTSLQIVVFPHGRYGLLIMGLIMGIIIGTIRLNTILLEMYYCISLLRMPEKVF